MKKSHAGDLHKGLSLGFGPTGLESGTSSAEVVKVVSSVEVMISVEVTVKVVIVASDYGASVAEGKGELRHLTVVSLVHKTKQ